MNNDELIAHVEKEEANVLVHYTSVLSEQRRKAMQYYYAEPYGNEVEGRSQVVTSEVKDAVEGQLPQLIAMFAASGEIVRCEPKKQGDEEAAQQATDYIHYVFWEKNPGFLILYSLIKDALLQKNGYCKAYFEKYEDTTKESYEGLNDLEFHSLLNDDEIELIEHTETPDTQLIQAMQQQAQSQGVALPPGIPQPMLHDAVFKRTNKHGKTCIDPLPPEEVLISRETPNELSKARFVEHRTLKTISEIREMGFDIPDDIADYAPNADFNLERVERLKYDDALAYRQDSDTNDPSTKRVWLCEAYCRVDFDGDGIAELRQIFKVGKTLLSNEEFDGLPIIGGTAILMPHKHYGLSTFDEIGDLQLQKSMVLRQLFDNAYVANNGRMEVLENMVNMSDLLTSRPNGLVRVKAMGSVKRIDNPLLGAPFYNLLEYLDKIKSNRVGMTDFPNGVDPDAINAKAAFVDAFKSASLERTALKGRVIAETILKPLFWKILELESKHQNKPLMARLRGKWVQVDPRDWANRFTMTVAVGLGTGSQQTTLNGAMGILQIQQGMMQIGLGNRVVSEQNAYAAARKYAQAVFPKDAESMFTDPKTLPPAQPPPNPEMLKIQLAAQKMQVGAAQKDKKMMLDAILEMKRMGLDVLKMAQDAHLASRDMAHDHVQNTMDRSVDLAMHQNEIDNQPVQVQ